jgi:2-deoxystreptamine N-acetyl-D-glucosaminyltransferase/2-deoxystreptamine glucosyltransferase
MGSIGTGLKVCVFTTSYPRSEDDFAGRFVSDAVAHLEHAGVEVDVVKPGVYRDFGLAFDGGGIMRNIRRKPWLAPMLFLSMVIALRRAARSADLVHAHWLAGALVAMFAGKPFVVTIHGSISGGFLDDFRLCERHPRIVRFVLSRARAVLCVSEALTEAVLGTGVASARFVPNGIAIPGRVCREDDSLQVFYTGRLSPEKGIKELAEATAGMNLVVTGDGPLRDLVPTRGFVSREELERCYEQAAVVVCPSLSEGFGVVCAEAMAHGKPVVASAVGGLANLIEDGRTGLLVPAGDVRALRDAIERLLSDGELRQHLGAAARERIVSFYGWKRVTEATLAAYQETVDSPRASTRSGSATRLAGITH